MAQDYYMGRKPSVSRRAGALDPQLIKPWWALSDYVRQLEDAS